MEYDCIIVGGGPAGLSAGLILGRCLRKVLLCDAGSPRNASSHAIHGLLGHDGTPPDVFLEEARAELLRHPSAVFRNGQVTSLSRSEAGFTFTCADGLTGTARKVLLATGLVDTMPAIPGVERFYGTAIHHCLYCDGFEYAGRPLLAFGAGDNGAALALMMRHWSPSVALCCAGELPSPSMRARLAEHAVRIFGAGIEEMIGDNGRLTAVHFEDRALHRCDAIFFSTGCTAGSELARHLGCARDDKGGIVTDPVTEETSVAGVYVAGDASRDVLLVASAIGEGAKAGVAINRALLKEAGLL